MPLLLPPSRTPQCQQDMRDSDKTPQALAPPVVVLSPGRWGGARAGAGRKTKVLEPRPWNQSISSSWERLEVQSLRPTLPPTQPEPMRGCPQAVPGHVKFQRPSPEQHVFPAWGGFQLRGFLKKQSLFERCKNHPNLPDVRGPSP